MNFKKITGAAAMTVAIALTLTACNGGGGSSDASGGGGTNEADSIRIMTIGPVDTTLQNFPDAQIGAQAAVDSINEAGGVNGRIIEWTFCNQKSDPNESTACAREAVREEVVAVVGMVDAFSTASIPILEKAGIAVLGNHSVGNEVDWESPSSFPFHGGAFAGHVAAVNAIKQQGGTRVQIFASDVAASTSQIEFIEQKIELEGLEHAGSVTIPLSGVTDFAPYAQQVGENDADGIIFITAAPTTTAIIRATHAMGLYPVMGYNAFSYGEAEFDALGADAEGVFVASPYPSYRESGFPAIQQFNDELDAAGAGDDPALRRLVGFNAWLAIHAFALVATDLSGEINAETFLAELNDLGETDLMGIIDWNPSSAGSNASFPRVPPTSMQFLATDDAGELRLMADLKTAPDPLAGIVR